MSGSHEASTAPTATEIRDNPDAVAAYLESAGSFEERRQQVCELLKYKTKDGQIAELLDIIDANCHDVIRGEVYRVLEDWKNAESALQMAAEQNSEDSAVWHNLGNTLYKRGKLSEAEAALLTATEQNSKNAAAWNDLGYVFVEQGKFSEAEEVLCKAIKLYPKNDALYGNLGYVFVEQGKFSEAEEVLRKAIKLYPKHATTHGNLGFVLLKQSKFAEAEVALLIARDLNPNSAIILECLIDALRAQQKPDSDQN